MMLEPVSSYDDLLKRLTRRMQETEVADQLFEIVRQAYDRELGNVSLVGLPLSRPQRVRLLQQVTAAVLADVRRKADGIQ
jgi:hypothetical protein